MVQIRLAGACDLTGLPAMELATGDLFRALGMDAVADDNPPTTEDLARYQRAGRLLVADDGGRGGGYLLIDVLPGAAHIEQVTVHPNHARRRIGRDLIDAAEHWARRRGLTWLTLTSYRDVPWNAPYYARLGFDVLDQDELSPELRAVRQAEAARGLDAWPRVTMRRQIGSAGRTGRHERSRHSAM
mgnify:CR=1 FL=1